MPIDDRAQALLDALNELFTVHWTCAPSGEFYLFDLVVYTLGGRPFRYRRAIRPEHINGEPFRTAIKFADEVCERYGRYLLLRPEDKKC